MMKMIPRRMASMLMLCGASLFFFPACVAATVLQPASRVCPVRSTVRYPPTRLRPLYWRP